MWGGSTNERQPAAAGVQAGFVAQPLDAVPSQDDQVRRGAVTCGTRDRPGPRSRIPPRATPAQVRVIRVSSHRRTAARVEVVSSSVRHRQAIPAGLRWNFTNMSSSWEGLLRWLRPVPVFLGMRGYRLVAGWKRMKIRRLRAGTVQSGDTRQRPGVPPARRCGRSRTGRRRYRPDRCRCRRSHIGADRLVETRKSSPRLTPSGRIGADQPGEMARITGMISDPGLGTALWQGTPLTGDRFIAGGRTHAGCERADVPRRQSRIRRARACRW